jgi:type II secretory pathway component PulC
MNSIGQYNYKSRKAAYAVLLIAIAGSLAILVRVSLMPAIIPSDDPNRQNTVEWIEPSSMGNLDWTVVQSSSGVVGSDVGLVSKKFRLAGTFIAHGGQNDKRRAILDNLTTHKQRIVSENEEIGGFLVLRIFTDRVVVRGQDGEEQLRLSFTGHGEVAEVQPDKDKKTRKGKFVPKKGLFGKQVGEHSYVIKREKLLAYYNELLDQPQRLVTVFDSLKPIWTEDRKIAGYHLDVEGEPEFFKELGWKQGDVVRTVNSMDMSNRYRAEYFINEFVADRANAFLIDMERDGETMKKVYRVR